MLTEKNMFRHSSAENSFFSAVAVLLLLFITVGQSAALSVSLQPTPTTAVTDSWTTARPNSSMEEPLALRSHTPCAKEYDAYCANGGQCMYPQDNNKPSCICQPSYHGPRCLVTSLESSGTVSHCEQVIAISVGVALLILGLAIIAYCCIHKRCSKKLPLIKPASSV
ncbi:epigen-like [Genypterus blacodes]|uniref:epigen-like n=1 Tax=Genypterus blacodes TaxID=154954 RepID=UPI003F75C565